MRVLHSLGLLMDSLKCEGKVEEVLFLFFQEEW